MTNPGRTYSHVIMKVILLLSCILLIASTSCKTDHKADTPDAVIAKFNELYPNTSDVTWEKEDTLYEATFKTDTVEKSIAFHPNGTVLLMETEINPEQLPQPIKDYVSQKHSGKPITGATLIVFVNGVNQYEAEVENKDYLFDALGQFVSVEEEESTGEKNE